MSYSSNATVPNLPKRDFLRLIAVLLCSPKHCQVTTPQPGIHPTAEWTIQQLREAVPSDHEYQFLIHDRHATFSSERLIGTIRRECLDFMIPLNERHLRAILRERVSHYNKGRPHSSLGPGIPDRRTEPLWRRHRHRLEATELVVSTPILGGLHHEYRLERTAA